VKVLPYTVYTPSSNNCQSLCLNYKFQATNCYVAILYWNFCHCLSSSQRVSGCSCLVAIMNTLHVHMLPVYCSIPTQPVLLELLHIVDQAPVPSQMLAWDHVINIMWSTQYTNTHLALAVLPSLMKQWPMPIRTDPIWRSCDLHDIIWCYHTHQDSQDWCAMLSCRKLMQLCNPSCWMLCMLYLQWLKGVGLDNMHWLVALYLPNNAGMLLPFCNIIMQCFNTTYTYAISYKILRSMDQNF